MVAMASTILLVPRARIDDVAHVVVVADAVVDGWGLVPCFSVVLGGPKPLSHMVLMVQAGWVQARVAETWSFWPTAP
jgi:hypothetical protein